MADLVELQNQLNNIEELLVLLVQVSDEKVPQLKDNINEIIKNIEDGFDTELLKKQAFDSLNVALTKADYSVLHKNLKQTSENLSSMINNLSKTVEEWKKLNDDASEQCALKILLGTFLAGIIIGSGGAVYYASKILHILM